MQPTNDFAIIPDRASIGSVEREIRFFPTHNDAPRVLSASDIEAWNRDGYLGPLEVYEAAEIAEIRTYFDQLLAQAISEGRDSYSISSAHLKHGGVWDMLTNPRIVGYVSDLLGQDVVGWGAHFFCKMPGDGKSVDWHQDCSYWPLTPTKAVTVWLAIDDSTLENGCMEVYNGSHQFGLIDFETSDSEAGNVLDQSVKHPEKYGTLQQTPIRAGQISIHSDLLVHGSAPNRSKNRRCGLTLRYCPADVTAYLGWNAKGVVVRGAADALDWPGAPRPMAD
ncbi:phytanoyl-CoA dioxygenase family protein [Rubripirellula reticaptiva]|uniref:Phytanoyl-CoA dioxygenase (PhyH) n=1 Tax=Rubripirellula reticaptiva TaxID=2528013 RepID=A0A5C6EMZ9_9BACT|nr:phytanoyl-CoA dioxygenase family protein [Rubripirellula reticaptiva]TWU51113.1 Phytanoyl-CoA dioxygenase (PhyH) [Rubripirellula reticaptiva]